jgi:tRNA G10  N-methylase Trm11
MQISKGEELDVLYEKFLDYCDQKLNEGGTVGVYTPKIEIIERLIQSSCFLIEFRLPLKMVTSVNSYLLPVLYTLKRKQ